MTDTAENRLAKIAKLVSFKEDDGGQLQISSINGDIQGDVWGDIHGTLVGGIFGDAVGNIHGDLAGGVTGTISGSVGFVKGSVGGNHAASVKERVKQLEAEQQEWYARQVELFNRDVRNAIDTLPKKETP
jgi:uncharacterized protein YcfJ